MNFNTHKKEQEINLLLFMCISYFDEGKLVDKEKIETNQ